MLHGRSTSCESKNAGKVAYLPICRCYTGDPRPVEARAQVKQSIFKPEGTIVELRLSIDKKTKEYVIKSVPSDKINSYTAATNVMTLAT